MSVHSIMRYFSPDGETTFDIQDARTGKSDYIVFNYNNLIENKLSFF